MKQVEIAGIINKVHGYIEYIVKNGLPTVLYFDKVSMQLNRDLWIYLM